MADNAKKTIPVKGRFFTYNEGDAAAAITPGDLIELTANDTVQRQSTAAATGPILKAFARENELFGKGLETDYALNDRCLYVVAPQGHEVHATLAAGAAAVADGANLEAAGDGTLRVVSTGDPVAQALEAVDNSGGGSKVWIRVMVL